VGYGDIQMKRNLVVLAAAALLAGMVATDALAAGHSGFGGGHIGGRFGPLTGSAPMPSPIYNPSTPYTVTQSPEVHVSPASGAIAQIPPPPITMTPHPNPSSSLVLPAPGEARVSPVNPGASPGNNLAGTNQVVNPPQSVFRHHPRRHHVNGASY